MIRKDRKKVPGLPAEPAVPVTLLPRTPMQRCLYQYSRNHPKLLSQKSWYLGIQNGPIARGFWNLNQSIEQKVKNLQLEKCRYIKDIQITFWDTAQYFHSKQLIKSVEKIFLLKFVHV